MVDVSNVNETSSEANWNRRVDGQTGRQTGGHANLCVGRLRLQKWGGGQMAHNIKKNYITLTEHTIHLKQGCKFVSCPDIYKRKFINLDLEGTR